jgi:hypothetical protein
MNPQSAGFFATLRMTIGKAQNDTTQALEVDEIAFRG